MPATRSDLPLPPSLEGVLGLRGGREGARRPAPQCPHPPPQSRVTARPGLPRASRLRVRGAPEPCPAACTAVTSTVGLNLNCPAADTRGGGGSVPSQKPPELLASTTEAASGAGLGGGVTGPLGYNAPGCLLFFFFFLVKPNEERQAGEQTEGEMQREGAASLGRPSGTWARALRPGRGRFPPAGPSAFFRSRFGPAANEPTAFPLPNPAAA